MNKIKTEDIHIRDPFVLPVKAEESYYLFGTTHLPGSDEKGFMCYRSKDLKTWNEPVLACSPDFTVPCVDFWAPEVFHVNDHYLMLASMRPCGSRRGTWAFISDNPGGHYLKHSPTAFTPEKWECLDGTLFFDENKTSWLIFCHEWTQCHDGEMCAIMLNSDLTRSIGQPIHLFNASDAAWAKAISYDGKHQFPNVITDGPFLHRCANGELLMLWSSNGQNGYAMGIARTQGAGIRGEWCHDPAPVWANDGGHGMIFNTFDGQMMLTLHQPNKSPKERPLFIPVQEKNGGLFLQDVSIPSISQI